jgi:hypothetical protein
MPKKLHALLWSAVLQIIVLSNPESAMTAGGDRCAEAISSSKTAAQLEVAVTDCLKVRCGLEAIRAELTKEQMRSVRIQTNSRPSSPRFQPRQKNGEAKKADARAHPFGRRFVCLASGRTCFTSEWSSTTASW